MHWDATSDRQQQQQQPPNGRTPSTSSRRAGHESPTTSRPRSLTRRQAQAEVDALWDELQEGGSALPAGAVASRGGGESGTSSPYAPRTRSRALTWALDQRGTPGCGSASPDLPRSSAEGGRSSPAGAPGFSPGSLARSGTGRSYRDRRASWRAASAGSSAGMGSTYGTTVGLASRGAPTPLATGEDRSLSDRARRLWRSARDAVAESVGGSNENESGTRRSSRSGPWNPLRSRRVRSWNGDGSGNTRDRQGQDRRDEEDGRREEPQERTEGDNVSRTGTA